MRPFRSVSPWSFGVQSASVFSVVTVEEISVTVVEIVVFGVVWLAVVTDVVVTAVEAVAVDVTVDIGEEVVFCGVVSVTVVIVVSMV